MYQIGDAQLAGTVFEEGVWLYIVYGAVLSALGAVTYWGPKLWGRTIPDKAALPLAVLGFIATVLASLPILIAGFAKQPANASEFDYSGPQNLWNSLSAAGHALMLVTVLAFVGLAIRSFPKGRLRRRRSVGRPDAGVGHLVAGAVRQLRRHALGGVGRTTARPEATEGPLMLALPSAAAPAPRGSCSSAPRSVASPPAH